MIKLRIIFASLFALLVLFAPVSAIAWSLTDGIDCTVNSDAAACHVDGSDPVTGPAGLLVDIAWVVSYVAGAAAIILILVGAIRYMTSGGDPGSVKKAKDSVLYALIGVVVVVIARTLIFFVVSFYK